MTRKVGNILFIEPEPPGICEMCGKKEELRPYGPNNENVCFDCAMKNPEAMEEKFNKRLESPGEKLQ